MEPRNRWLSLLICGAALAAAGHVSHQATAEEETAAPGLGDLLPNTQNRPSASNDPKTGEDEKETEEESQDERRTEIETLSKTIEDDPADLAARQRRAELYLELDENDRALADADKLVALQPEEASSFRLRGKIHAKMERFERVVDDLSEALRLDPADAESYRERGAAYIGIDDIKRGFADITRAVELNPDDSKARQGHIFLQSLLGNYEEAIREAGGLIEKIPDDSINVRLRGQIHQDWGFFEQALVDFEEAVRLAPDGANANRAMADALLIEGRPEEAIAALTKAILIAPTDSNMYDARAAAYCALGNWERARGDLRASLRLRGKVENLVQMAAVRALAGDGQWAVGDYQAGMEAVAPRKLAAWQPTLFQPAAEAVEPPAIEPPATEAAADVSAAEEPRVEVDRPDPDNIVAEFTVGDVRTLVVPVRVGGRTLRMALDTGSSCTGLHRSHRDLLSAERGKMDVNTAGSDVRVSFHEPLNLGLGKLAAVSTESPAACLDLTVLREGIGLPIDGILGMDVLSQFVLEIDLARHKVYLLRSCGDDAGVAIPLVDTDPSPASGNKPLGRPRPEILLTLPSGKAVPFCIDTGSSSGSIAIDRALYRQLVEQGHITPLRETLHGSLGSIQTSRDGILAKAELGDFRHHHLIVNEFGKGNVIGLAYLARFVVTFDFAAKRLLLRPSPLFATSEAERTLRMGGDWIQHVYTRSAAESLELLSQYILADPGDPSRYRQRARYYMAHGEYDKAIADIEEMIRLDPSDAVNFQARGIAYSYKQESDLAIASFDKAIAMEPTMPAAWRSRGLAWAIKGDFRRALGDLDEALRLSPNYTGADEDRQYVLTAWKKATASAPTPKRVVPCRRCARRWHWRVRIGRCRARRAFAATLGAAN